MQQATTVVSCLCESRSFFSIGMGVLSLQIVRDWLACLFKGGTISADSKIGGLSCLIELSQ